MGCGQEGYEDCSRRVRRMALNTPSFRLTLEQRGEGWYEKGGQRIRTNCVHDVRLDQVETFQRGKTLISKRRV